MTPEREKKFIAVLNKRQPNLTVILENVHDPHNISAVLRSCDAVGIREIYTINSVPLTRKELGTKSSASAKKWVEVHSYSNVDECFKVVRQKYKHIYGTHLNSTAVSIYELTLSDSVALAFGNEHSGLSENALSLCNGNFIIPQVGMIHSLNISVACAVSVYEAFRQRNLKGMYNTPQLPETEINANYDQWVKRDFNK